MLTITNSQIIFRLIFLIWLSAAALRFIALSAKLSAAIWNGGDPRSGRA
jgi:hypothetical protein